MKNLCNLCLKSTNTKKCAESKLFIELLEVILLDPWWNISKTPTLCNKCSLKIAKAFGFKSNCVYAEELLHPHLTSNGSSLVDLRTVYSKIRKYDIKSLQAEQFLKICCLCINFISRSPTPILDLLKGYHFEEKFSKYIPEMDLHIIDQPLICQQCSDSLRDFIEFVICCTETSEKIKKYRKTMGVKDDAQIDLDKFLSEVHDIDCFNIPDKTDAAKDEINCGSEISELSDQEESDEETRNCKKQKTIKRSKLSGSKVQKNTDESEEKLLHCTYCDYQTPSKHKLQRHNNRMHYEFYDVPKYTCEKCNYQTTDKYYLKRHSLRHKDSAEVEVYHCQKCTFETRYKAILRGHTKTHLNKDEVQMYHCQKCSFATKFKSGLNQHKKIHEDISKRKTFKCGIGTCTYQTIEKSYLNKHIKRHGEPPEMETLYCYQCDYQTKYKKHMRTHMTLKHIKQKR